MKEAIPKWRLEKVEVVRNGKIDGEYSGYELQKNGVMLCKFKLESLVELKELFTNFVLPPNNND